MLLGNEIQTGPRVNSGLAHRHLDGLRAKIAGDKGKQSDHQAGEKLRHCSPSF